MLFPELEFPLLPEELLLLPLLELPVFPEEELLFV